MGTVTFTYPIAPKSIGGFEIDVFVSEQYTFANKMTNIPIDEGVNISDHVREEPDTVEIEAFIGNAVFEVHTGQIPEDLSEIEIPDPKTRIRLAYHELLRLKRERQPIELVTGLDTFSDMVIVHFKIGRDAATGADLPFTMRFQRARTALSEATEIHASRDQTGRTADMGPTGRQNAPQEDFVERTAYNRWLASGGRYPTTEEFVELFGRTPEQFAELFGG